MQKLTITYCPKDGTELHVVAQHKGRKIGLLTVFENCPKCGRWLTYTAENLDYLPVFVSCALLPDELPKSKIRALVANANANGPRVSRSNGILAAA